ncbi:hypothetical protein BVRB_6g129270 [Beta vulgaris subsp. vulgaris]|nr:hypothetical protein BVRB_6g129270 [Beta vulgaris subsp. vulgaris]
MFKITSSTDDTRDDVAKFYRARKRIVGCYNGSHVKPKVLKIGLFFKFTTLNSTKACAHFNA